MFVALAMVLALSRLRRARGRLGLVRGPRRPRGAAVPRRVAAPAPGFQRNTRAFAADRRGVVPAWADPDDAPLGGHRGESIVTGKIRSAARRSIWLDVYWIAAVAAAAAILVPSLGFRTPGWEMLQDEVVAPLRASLPPRPAPKQDLADIRLPDPAPASPPREPYRITWPYDIADGLTFGPDGAVKTRLAGLVGPSRDAVCSDEDGNAWACGLQARAALNNATRQSTLVCDPVGAVRSDLVTARCCNGEDDVGRAMVLAGFARSEPPDPAFQDAEEEARREGRGLWNGDWTIRLPPAR